jgi:carbamoyl-phosphate synthase large subunit
MTAPAIVLACVAALVVASVCWRWLNTSGLRRRCADLLNSADPATRITGVTLAGEFGLGATAGAILRLARTEADGEVLAAICDLVARNQWEPASSRRLVELRLWAKAHIEEYGSPGTLRLPPSRVGRRQGSGDLNNFAADPDPLPPTQVLVTGAGGAAGVAVIRALKAAGHQAIAVDADGDAAGLFLADQAFEVPRADDPDYVARLLAVAESAGADALICTVAEEYRALVPAVERFAAVRVRTLFPEPDAVARCLDKWQFFRAMTQAGLPTPPTALGRTRDVAGPWVVKPRFGRGSRQVSFPDTVAALGAAVASTDNPLVQTKLSGREFTVDVLTDATGTVVGAVPRWRLETKGGISTKGETFAHPEVSNQATLAVKAVGVVGPANVQGFLSEDDEVTIHEINPRFSGGLPLSLAAGSDLVGEYLRAVMGRPMRAERLTSRPGVRMSRYFAETFS